MVVELRESAKGEVAAGLGRGGFLIACDRGQPPKMVDVLKMCSSCPVPRVLTSWLAVSPVSALRPTTDADYSHDSMNASSPPVRRKELNSSAMTNWFAAPSA